MLLRQVGSAAACRKAAEAMLLGLGELHLAMVPAQAAADNQGGCYGKRTVVLALVRKVHNHSARGVAVEHRIHKGHEEVQTLAHMDAWAHSRAAAEHHKTVAHGVHEEPEVGSHNWERVDNSHLEEDIHNRNEERHREADTHQMAPQVEADHSQYLL